MNGPPVYHVLGVVKGYYPDLVHVATPHLVKPGEDLSQTEGWRIQRDAQGRTIVLRDTPQVVPTNSGILLGSNISRAVDLIHQHPVGPRIEN
jgi:Flp pilus assembly secretin CpaC